MSKNLKKSVPTWDSYRVSTAPCRKTECRRLGG